MNIDLYKRNVTAISFVQDTFKDLLKITEERMVDKKDCYTNWIKEEYEEFMAEKDGTPEQAKELSDLIWVCFQKANKQGYDLSKCLQALVEEYCSKFYTVDGKYEPIYREDGKLLKNTGFKKADFSTFIKKD